MTLNVKIEQRSPQVLILTSPAKSGAEQWFLLTADQHHDNLHADHKLERKHLDQAKERNAGILCFGDMFCAMQGKWDKRADQNQLRPELRGNTYLDSLVRYNADFYEPYWENFVHVSRGNHETSILRHHETDLMQRLAERLNERTGHAVPVGTYRGWVLFRFQFNQTKAGTVRLAFHHGYGGDAPVTKGTIQTARQGVYLPDAQIVVTGHTHNEWQFTIQRDRISDMGRTYLDEQVHIKVPGYKDEYSCGDGWHNERGGPPKPKGAAWLRLFVDKGDANVGRVSYEITRAK